MPGGKVGRVGTVEERFWRKVDRSAGPDGCWNWLASTAWGYGAFGYDGRIQRAHRVAWALLREPITDPKVFLCHHCDNRACVNPNHMFLGTHIDNMRDMVQKGRSPRTYGPRNGRSAGATL